MKDELGDRMKRYEGVHKTSLMRRSYTIIRIDGKAFHTYTKGLLKPFDKGLIDDMNSTAKYLCENIQGAKFAYTQSDEISILLTDFDELTTQAWFGNEVQKMVSVAASLATAEFNRARIGRAMKQEMSIWGEPVKLAHFDARVFQLPTQTEVINYFIWRQMDCIRNSVSSVAQSEFSSKELHGVSTVGKKEMLIEKGIDWTSLPNEYKYGRETVKEEYQLNVKTLKHGGVVGDNDLPWATRTRWITLPSQPYPKVSYLASRIPLNT